MLKIYYYSVVPSVDRHLITSSEEMKKKRDEQISLKVTVLLVVLVLVRLGAAVGRGRTKIVIGVVHASWSYNLLYFGEEENTSLPRRVQNVEAWECFHPRGSPPGLDGKANDGVKDQAGTKYDQNDCPEP